VQYKSNTAVVVDRTTIPNIKKRAEDIFQHDNVRTGRYLKFGSKYLDKATEGIEYSTFIIPAPANLGKSTLLINIYHQLILNNPEAFVLDFTLDDTFDIRYRNSLARISKLSINSMKYPDTLSDPEKRIREAAAKTWETDIASKLIILDKTDFNDRATRLTTIEKMIYYTKDNLKGKNKKLIVIIDGLHDIYVDDFPGNANNQIQTESWVSKRISDIADGAKCTIIASAHTPKGSRRRGNSPDAIKGSSNFGYDAKIIGAVYSDYKINRENAEIFHEIAKANQPDITEKLPVIELDITKNKVSDFSDIIFMKHYPVQSRAEEADEAWQEHWKNVIYNTDTKKQKRT